MAVEETRGRKRKRKDKRKLDVDEKVEVRSREDGFLGSWHVGTVIACKQGVRHVKYDNLLLDDASDNFVDVVTMSPFFDGNDSGSGNSNRYRGYIRPIPPPVELGVGALPYGLCVDVYYQDAWWEGVVFDHEDDSEERKVFFPDLGDEMRVEIKTFRATQDWDEATENWKRRGTWAFLEVIEQYEQEHYLAISLKQIWYDVREKKDFRKIWEWTSTMKDLWKELVMEVINEYLDITLKEMFRAFKFSGRLSPETEVAQELHRPSVNVNLNSEVDKIDPDNAVPDQDVLNSHDLSLENGAGCTRGLEPEAEEELELYKPAAEVTILNPEVDPVKSYPIVPVRDSTNSHVLRIGNTFDSCTSVMEETFEGGGLESELMHTSQKSAAPTIQPIEGKSDVEDRSIVMPLTESGSSCHYIPPSVLPLPLFPLSLELDGIPVANSITCEELATGESSIHGKPESTSLRTHGNWRLISTASLRHSGLCPDAVTRYALSDDKKRPSVTEIRNMRKHLSSLGWKIELMKNKFNRFRYTSPSGKRYHSLHRVCKTFAQNNKENVALISQNNERSLHASSDNLISYRACEQTQKNGDHDCEAQVAMPCTDVVYEEPEYCPQAVMDYHAHALDKISGKRKSEMRSKARKHLLSMGWNFRYILCGKRYIWTYISPRRTYFSLRKACKVCVDEGGDYEKAAVAYRPTESILATQEDEDQTDKLSSVPMNVNLQESLALSNAQPKICSRESFLSLSGDNRNPGQTKSKGPRRRNQSIIHVASHFLQEKNNLITKREGLKLTFQLTGNRFRRRQRKDICQKVNRGIRVLRSSKRVHEVHVPSATHQNPRTILSWLIENNVVLPRTKVHYRSKKDSQSMAEGRITRDGIRCCCCQSVFTVNNFEVHAGSACRRPSANIILEDGRSLLDCQKEILVGRKRGSLDKKPLDRRKCGWHKGKNDYICSICHYGGELILCDKCPSSFHKGCLGLQDVPEGEWFCPSCCCGICGQSKCNEDSDVLDNSIITCQQCEHKYHVTCLRSRQMLKLGDNPNKTWFCSKKCDKIFWGLQRLLGKPILVGDTNLTWSLLKATNPDSEFLVGPDIEVLTEDYSKLNVALGVMHECFEPVKERHTRRDLVEDIIFSRGSELNRLNFEGFYTVLLERNDELITVATVRVYGEEVAEVPLVGTRFQYRRMGMCRILMNELEKRLKDLGVKRLVLPAIPSVLNTWTSAFGFSKMTDRDRREFLNCTFLDFQGTIMCQKLLLESPTVDDLSRGFKPKLHNDIFRSCDSVDLNGSSAISEVYQAEHTEEKNIMNQGKQTIICASNISGSSDGSDIVMVNQTEHIECHNTHEAELIRQCSIRDGNLNEVRRYNADIKLRCYKRRMTQF